MAGVQDYGVNLSAHRSRDRVEDLADRQAGLALGGDLLFEPQISRRLKDERRLFDLGVPGEHELVVQGVGGEPRPT